MLQQDKAEDFVIATGESNSLDTFISMVFDEFSLDWEKHVNISHELYRPTDLDESRANPSKAKELLGWNAQYHLNDIVKFLISEKI